ncbi:hypothetical protein [Rugamonas sp.]|uniref:esterase/lipase family protein n=1 Tax=Rugamonas sp. TaxID=1926287 RepID=UPI0025D79F79|nr:hypothetical protein [Rugamonas sp.]
MYTHQAGLTAAKNLELERALRDADGRTVGRDLALREQIHPLTQERGLTLPLTAPALDLANLTVLQHKVSGCIQFAFPVQGAQPVPQLTPQAPGYAFGFIRPRQLGIGAAAAGLLDWTVKAALHLAQGGVTQAVVREIERRSKPEGFINLSRGYRQPATAAELAQARGQKVLLFIHGIFSSTAGAFDDLGAADDGAATLRPLLERYRNLVFGYDHWTISKTPQQNAVDLLNAIPADAGWDIDIVCHSRGGLVVRSLLAVVADGAAPATAELQQIAALRRGRIAQIGRAFFIAAANQGSPLADPDQIRDFLNAAALLASRSDCFGLDLVIGLAQYVVSSGFGLPAIEALDGSSQLIADLNARGTLLDAAATYYARADFDYAQSALLETGVFLDKYLIKVDNDLVVPYDGVSLPEFDVDAAHRLNFGTPAAKQGRVWHTEFFCQPETRQFLRDGLV